MYTDISPISSLIWKCISMSTFRAAFHSTPRVVSRPGLYGFELGVLNTEQELSDARHRSAIGAVDTALVSFATLFMYGSGILFGSPEQFGILVESSSCCVCTAAMTYLRRGFGPMFRVGSQGVARAVPLAPP